MKDKCMSYERILSQVEVEVRNIFRLHAGNAFIYHNIFHTETVVKHVKEISGHYNLCETDLFIVLAAAWFHDTGYLFANANVHEEKSVEIMRTFLSQKNISAELIQDIESCIMSTKLAAQPNTLLERIIKDADTYNLGTNEFIETNNLVKAEAEQLNNMEICDWDNLTMNLLLFHKFYTSYCAGKLSGGKEENINYVRSLIKSKINY